MSDISPETIIEKMKELPESDQQTILDFIEYLMEKEERKQKAKQKENK